MNGNNNATTTTALAPLVERGGTAIEVRQPQADPATLLMIAQQFASSGFFQDARQAAQAFVKVQYGAELGIGPATAMMSVQVIQGKPAPSAGLLAALIKRSGKYNYRVLDWTNQQCILEFYEDGKAVGRSPFTLEDAQQAGALDGPNKHTWQKYPRNMLFARALTTGQRAFCPDVTLGPVYTAEELDVPVDGEGNVIDVTPAPLPAPLPSPAPDALWRSVNAHMKRLGIRGRDERTVVAEAILGVEITDSAALPVDEVEALNKALASFKDDDALSAHLDRARAAAVAGTEDELTFEDAQD